MIIKKIEIAFVCIGLSLLIMLVFLAAALRWFGIDMSWSTDLAQLTFAWVCLIGADLAMRQDSHMGVDLLTNKLFPKTRNSIFLFNNIVILFFLILVAIYGINLVIINFQRSFNTLPISYSYATASAPVGAILMIMTTVRKINGYILNIKNEDFSNIQVEREGGEII